MASVQNFNVQDGFPEFIYAAHQLGAPAWAATNLLALAGRQAFENSPFSGMPLVLFAKAGFELLERATRVYIKPPWNIEPIIVGDQKHPVREGVVWRTPFCEVRHFTHDAPGNRPKTLVVAPMSGHYATLLRGTVQDLLLSHDVYITDWVDAKKVPLSAGKFDLDDFANTIIAALSAIGPGAHVIVVCQPAPIVFAAAARMAEDHDPCQPLSLTLMAGPIDTRVNPTDVNRLATENSIESFRKLTCTVGAGHLGMGRQIYPGLFQLQGFVSMNLDRHIGAHMDLFNSVLKGDFAAAQAKRVFYDNYFAVMDMPGEFYVPTIEKIFQLHEIPRGLFKINGRTVDFGAIKKIALLTVEGGNDDICGIGQTEAAHGLAYNLPPSLKKHHLQPRVGHYGVFAGSGFRNEIVPIIEEFVLQNNAPLRDHPISVNAILPFDDEGPPHSSVVSLRHSVPSRALTFVQ